MLVRWSGQPGWRSSLLLLLQVAGVKRPFSWWQGTRIAGEGEQDLK